MDKIAVLIPCYNENKTVEKVVTDFKNVLPEATIYIQMIITRRTIPSNWLKKPTPSCDTNISKAKEM